MVEYVKKAATSSGVAKVGAVLGGTALGLNLLGANTGGILGGLTGAPVRYAPPVAFGAEAAAFQGGYVTEKELCLTREIGDKDAMIAQLNAEKYADAAVRAATDPLNVRVCNLETAAAVNAARDQGFRRYVNAEFIHQPKASIRESIVVCQQCGCEPRDCCCGRDRERCC